MGSERWGRGVLAGESMTGVSRGRRSWGGEMFISEDE